MAAGVRAAARLPAALSLVAQALCSTAAPPRAPTRNSVGWEPCIAHNRTAKSSRSREATSGSEDSTCLSSSHSPVPTLYGCCSVRGCRWTSCTRRSPVYSTVIPVDRQRASNTTYSSCFFATTSVRTVLVAVCHIGDCDRAANAGEALEPVVGLCKQRLRDRGPRHDVYKATLARWALHKKVTEQGNQVRLEHFQCAAVGGMQDLPVRSNTCDLCTQQHTSRASTRVRTRVGIWVG